MVLIYTRFLHARKKNLKCIRNLVTGFQNFTSSVIGRKILKNIGLKRAKVLDQCTHLSGQQILFLLEYYSRL